MAWLCCEWQYNTKSHLGEMFWTSKRGGLGQVSDTKTLWKEEKKKMLHVLEASLYGCSIIKQPSHIWNNFQLNQKIGLVKQSKWLHQVEEILIFSLSNDCIVLHVNLQHGMNKVV